MPPRLGALAGVQRMEAVDVHAGGTTVIGSERPAARSASRAG